MLLAANRSETGSICSPGAGLPVDLLVHPNMVNVQVQGVLDVERNRAAESSAKSEIHDQEEGLVEDPIAIADVLWPYLIERLTVIEPLDSFFVPLD